MRYFLFLSFYSLLPVFAESVIKVTVPPELESAWTELIYEDFENGFVHFADGFLNRFLNELGTIFFPKLRPMTSPNR